MDKTINKVQPVLSIIVPCYKSFSAILAYLKQLDAQKIENIECIIIDDCSEELTLADMVEQAGQIKSFDVIVSQNDCNRGPGVTRNNGIILSKGLYITFLDADDYLSADYFETIMPLLDEDYDCIIHDFLLEYDNGRQVKSSGFFCEFADGMISTEEAIVYTRGTTCGKVYKRDVVVESGIQFLSQRRNEDIPFTKCVIGSCKRIRYVAKPMYIYIQHGNSLTHNKALLDPENAKRGFQYISAHLENSYPSEIEAVFILDYLLSTCQTNIDFMSRKEWIDYVNDAESRFPGYLKNKYLGKFAALKKILIRFIHYKQYSALKIYRKMRERLR